MAHFAELDAYGRVIAVVVLYNAGIEVNGVESEDRGIALLERTSGHRRWKQTSYNGSFRKNYAGIGYVYDSVREAFIAPRPYKSWSLDQVTCRWVPPTPRPDGYEYEWKWNEETEQWQK
jgi:hypothetical protein